MFRAAIGVQRESVNVLVRRAFGVRVVIDPNAIEKYAHNEIRPVAKNAPVIRGASVQTRCHGAWITRNPFAVILQKCTSAGCALNGFPACPRVWTLRPAET